jgi:hypothetical protein
MILGVSPSSHRDDVRARVAKSPATFADKCHDNHCNQLLTPRHESLRMSHFGLPSTEMACPKWNFRTLFSDSLEACNDHVVRAGKTFNCSESSIERLAKGKKAILVLGSSGIFSEGPWKRWDSVEPYLGQILGIIGIEDIHRACRGHEHTTACDPCDTQW